MTRYVKLKMEVDVSGDGQSTKEVDMMRTHIPMMYVDMIGEGIMTNKVDDNSLLEGDDVLLEMMMTLKLKVKLGQFLKICPQLMKMMEKYLMKMKTNQVIDVCKVSIIKVEDFDEAILVVQVQIGKFEVRNVLLNRGFDVNIISKSLRKKLELRKHELTSFVIHMANQQNVQPMGLFQNLKIDLAYCVYKISVIILKMENEVETYSMLVGRPWLKQANVHHNWGDNTLTIISENKIMMLNMIKHVNIKSSQ